MFLDAVIAWRWVLVKIAASRAWAVSTLSWCSWMSQLLIVDSHLGDAARLRYLDKGAELCCLHLDLVPVLAADRRGLLQVVARVVWGLQWWQTLKGPSLHRSTGAPQPVELPMERAGPSTWSVPAVSLALLPTTGCRSLHRRVSRSFWRGRFRLRSCSGGSNAWIGSGNDGYAFPTPRGWTTGFSG